MKRTFQIIIFSIVIFSCAKNTKQQKEQSEPNSNGIEVNDSTILEQESSIDTSAQLDSLQTTLVNAADLSLINYVKANSFTRSDTLDFEKAFPYNKNYHKLPDKYKDQLNGLPVQNYYKETLTVDQYDRYNLIDYFQDSNFFYFRILIDDEYCCRSLYAITLNKNDESFHNLSFLGLKGGDGGWGEMDTEYWTSDSSLLYIKLSTYDEDIYEDGYRRTTDSMVVEYTIKDGRFNKELLDSIHYEQKISSN